LIDHDYDLLSRCLKKEVAAEDQLYHQFAPKMYGLCLRYAGNETEAEDILQDGFMRLFNHMHQFRFEGRVEAWIRRIFVRTAINYYQQNLKFSMEVELKNADDLPALQEDALSALSAKELLAIIQHLTPAYRTIFNMHVIENYAITEIADLLGISEGTARSQFHRAKNRVRQMLIQRENYHTIS